MAEQNIPKIHCIRLYDMPENFEKNGTKWNLCKVFHSIKNSDKVERELSLIKCFKRKISFEKAYPAGTNEKQLTVDKSAIREQLGFPMTSDALKKIICTDKNDMQWVLAPEETLTRISGQTDLERDTFFEIGTQFDRLKWKKLLPDMFSLRKSKTKRERHEVILAKKRIPSKMNRNESTKTAPVTNPKATASSSNEAGQRKQTDEYESIPGCSVDNIFKSATSGIIEEDDLDVQENEIPTRAASSSDEEDIIFLSKQAPNGPRIKVENYYRARQASVEERRSVEEQRKTRHDPSNTPTTGETNNVVRNSSNQRVSTKQCALTLPCSDKETKKPTQTFERVHVKTTDNDKRQLCRKGRQTLKMGGTSGSPCATKKTKENDKKESMSSKGNQLNYDSKLHGDGMLTEMTISPQIRDVEQQGRKTSQGQFVFPKVTNSQNHAPTRDIPDANDNTTGDNENMSKAAKVYSTTDETSQCTSKRTAKDSVEDMNGSKSNKRKHSEQDTNSSFKRSTSNNGQRGSKERGVTRQLEQIAKERSHVIEGQRKECLPETVGRHGKEESVKRTGHYNESTVSQPSEKTVSLGRERRVSQSQDKNSSKQSKGNYSKYMESDSTNNSAERECNTDGDSQTVTQRKPSQTSPKQLLSKLDAILGRSQNHSVERQIIHGNEDRNDGEHSFKKLKYNQTASTGESSCQNKIVSQQSNVTEATHSKDKHEYQDENSASINEKSQTGDTNESGTCAEDRGSKSNKGQGRQQLPGSETRGPISKENRSTTSDVGDTYKAGTSYEGSGRIQNESHDAQRNEGHYKQRHQDKGGHEKHSYKERRPSSDSHSRISMSTEKTSERHRDEMTHRSSETHSSVKKERKPCPKALDFTGTNKSGTRSESRDGRSHNELRVRHSSPASGNYVSSATSNATTETMPKDASLSNPNRGIVPSYNESHWGDMKRERTADQDAGRGESHGEKGTEEHSYKLSYSVGTTDRLSKHTNISNKKRLNENQHTTQISSCKARHIVTLLVGDSMLQHIQSETFFKSKNVVVKMVTGARVDSISDRITKFVQQENPSDVILHIGTNDLHKGTLHIASHIESVGKLIKETFPSVAKFTISSIIQRREDVTDTRCAKVSEVNKELRRLQTKHGWDYINNDNMYPEDHLSRDGIHLNASGIEAFAANIERHLALVECGLPSENTSALLRSMEPCSTVSQATKVQGYGDQNFSKDKGRRNSGEADEYALKDLDHKSSYDIGLGTNPETENMQVNETGFYAQEHGQSERYRGTHTNANRWVKDQGSMKNKEDRSYVKNVPPLMRDGDFKRPHSRYGDLTERLKSRESSSHGANRRDQSNSSARHSGGASHARPPQAGNQKPFHPGYTGCHHCGGYDHRKMDCPDLKKRR